MTRYKRFWRWFSGLGSLLAFGGVIVSTNCALAQQSNIVPDNTLGTESSVVTPNVDINGIKSEQISGGASRGNNLFHSFQEFNIRDGRGAYFDNPAGIENILSRVIGGNASSILGKQGVLGNANLFLINPKGIIFGKNASLDVKGSFIASTASSLKFADGTQFSATAPQATSLLTVSVPIGLQYGENVGSILNQSSGRNSNNQIVGLQVEPDKTLALVGGDVMLLGGRLTTAGGRIELGSVADNSLVSLNPTDNGYTLGYESVQNFQDIKLSQRAVVNASGSGGGDIQLSGRHVRLTDGSQVQANTNDSKSGGIIAVTASEAVEIIGTSADGKERSRLRTETQGDGKAGAISITTKRLSVQNGALISTGASLNNGVPISAKKGAAGNLTIRASDVVEVIGERADSNFESRLTTQTAGSESANAGDITITTNRLVVKGGGQISAGTYPRSQGEGGSLTITASDSIEVNGASADGKEVSRLTNLTTGEGNAKNLTITTGKLIVQGGGRVHAGSMSSSSNPDNFSLGSGGNLNITASDSVEIIGGLEYSALRNNVSNRSRITTQAEGAGNAGDLTITTGKLVIQDGAQVSAGTLGASNNQLAGRSDGGDVNINVTGAVDIVGRRGTSSSGIFSNVGKGKVGDAGSITINSGSFSLRDGALLSAETSGQGNAGNVTVRARDAISLERASINSSVQASGVGNGGNIDINAVTLSLISGDRLLNSTTSGQGNAGNVTVWARDAIFLERASINTNVESGGVGKGGNIDINAATLSLIDSGQLQTSTSSTSNNQPGGRGDAGNVNVNVTGAVNIAGRVGNSPSGIFSYVGTGTVGDAGNITINSGSLSLQNGARLSTQTFTQGNAGNVTVRARDAVSLITNAGINGRIEALGEGKAGNININAASLSLIDGSQLQTATGSASNNRPGGRGDAGDVNVKVTGAVEIVGGTSSLSGIFSYVGRETVGDGGNITIDSGSLSLQNRAELSTQTFAQGNAGTITVNAADFVTISGSSSNFNTGLFVNSQTTTGTTGNIIVTSPKVTLKNNGRLNAQSTSGNGGNINLQTDLLFLRRGAQISTTAGTAQAGGDGGNINIDAPSGFIVAASRENNDITANAFRGSGGRVTINATGIFGMTVRSREDLVRLLGTNLNPQFLPTNDITAFSQTNPTLNGTITVNSPDVDPNRGLLNLPTVPIDTSVVQSCTAGGFQAQSKFVITGRGGLPSNAGETLTSNAVQVGLVTLKPEVAQLSTPVSTNSIKSAPVPIIEATGWVKDASGNVVLTANASTVTPYDSWQKTADCRGYNP
ncbi:filamentous hemagglutinin outer membrane protein [Calothrix sp. NIES-4071]|nr:filamentous hemagglutinin outer membrane protein [Calothrix sp. NIES-4071]BAZ58653.1 filamentous hemagglutinin outer membrane protein [Calothrix sp. NIES-4105]